MGYPGNETADTSILLDTWGESLTVKRAANTYSAGRVTSQSWVDHATISGDWQPVSGRTVRREEGRAVRSQAQVYAVPDVDVAEGDRVYRADGSYMYVNYVIKYEDHWVLMLTRTEPN